ncbi:type III secretion system gatekeeper subunit SctW [Providencia rettgeri]|uniref:Type III secretion system gatekeeper subunit SctW n=2 Tax=Providencia TaxID=586 RepID=A0AAW6UAJ7_PRORE|nr:MULTISPECIES: type III secretion system gatekeeper subunit SctW [Providencia]MBG5893596.1 type III secretion system gatekeeper subunit SctW [Providencia rettgeri]MBQ0529176.1 type III secretion system gatekeeper subunit SctW [Providencia rettgeri]MDI9092258.1 type III secretion system gatekeeper subunit SctW [Providencia rettgeri]MDT2037682.1 type III secretion system gatekeeper subunit SctW [Providencia rettgeri]THB29459.1 YopN family type III secretion system gatekeeper subunit [Providenc
MAITPLGFNTRFSVNTQNKSRAPVSSSSDDSDEVARGAGVIDSSSEYASMSMLAASHVRRGSSKKSSEEDWLQFSERILDKDADDKVLHIEGLLNKQLMTPKQLRAFLLQFFTDPSDLLMLLAALLNRKKLKKEQIDNLEALAELLQAEDTERSAQAGINVALIAKAFAKKLHFSAGNLRTLYREFISYDGPVVYLYEQWVEEMEIQERENMMRYLGRALACDLQALPLGDLNITEFGSFFSRVGRLRELQSLDYVFCQQFFQSGFFRHNGKSNQSKLEKELSQLFTRGIRNHVGFEEVVITFINNILNIMSSDIRGQFLQLLLLAFSIIPVTVFPSLEAREELIDQLKKLMDQVMVKEPFLHRHS